MSEQTSRSGDLSDWEKRYQEKRSVVTMKAMQLLLGSENGPRSLEETPVVALVMSGGGYRAMSTCCGATEALVESGIFDALTYNVGLSGSVWYLSTTYARKSFSSLEHLKKDHDWIRGQLGKDLNFGAMAVVKYAFKSIFKSKTYSLTDVFGLCLRDVLLMKEHGKATMSSLRQYVQEGKVPLPIFSAAHVQNNYPIFDFWEEVKLNPNEATYPSYRLLVPIEDVNSVWTNGVLSKKKAELMLHYIMGLCGCAFAIMPYHISDAHENKERSFRDSWKDMIKGAWNAVTGSYGPDMPYYVMSEVEFKEKIWDQGLASFLAKEGEDVNIEEAYQMYLRKNDTIIFLGFMEQLIATTL